MKSSVMFIFFSGAKGRFLVCSFLLQGYEKSTSKNNHYYHHREYLKFPLNKHSIKFNLSESR